MNFARWILLDFKRVDVGSQVPHWNVFFAWFIRSIHVQLLTFEMIVPQFGNTSENGRYVQYWKTAIASLLTNHQKRVSTGNFSCYQLYGENFTSQTFTHFLSITSTVANDQINNEENIKLDSFDVHSLE